MAVRNKQDAILCNSCGKWSHVKCLNMSRPIFFYYLNRPDVQWSCPFCALPPLTDSFFEDEDVDILIDQQVIAAPGEDNDPLHAVQAEENIQLESLRKHSSRELLVCHLNINSIQNKFEELADLIKRLQR